MLGLMGRVRADKGFSTGLTTLLSGTRQEQAKAKLRRETLVPPVNPFRTGEVILMRKQMHLEKKDLITGVLFTEIIILLIVGEKTNVHNEIKV